MSKKQKKYREHWYSGIMEGLMTYIPGNRTYHSIQARRARKKLKDEDKTRLDASISALEEALRGSDEYRIKTASEDLDTILRSVGTYASSPEGENDDGAYDA